MMRLGISGPSCHCCLSSQKEMLQHPHEAQFLHTVLYSIMALHEGFLCAADEHVDIEVINLFSFCIWDTPSHPSAVGFSGIASVL